MVEVNVLEKNKRLFLIQGMATGKKTKVVTLL
jgi:hypothetical protein